MKIIMRYLKPMIILTTIMVSGIATSSIGAHQRPAEQPFWKTVVMSIGGAFREGAAVVGTAVGDGVKETGKFVGKGLSTVGRHILGKDLEEQRQKLVTEISTLKLQLSNPSSWYDSSTSTLKQEIATAEAELVRVEKRQAEGRKRTDRLLSGAADIVKTTVTANANAQANAPIELQKHTMTLAQELKKFKDVKTFALKALAACSIAAGAYYGGRLAYRYVEGKMGRPRIIEDTNLRSRIATFLAFFTGETEAEEDSRMTEVIASEAILTKLKKITRVIQTARENDETMPNILLYGPPGTGKTMFATALAKESGLDYVTFSGTSLTKLPNGQDRIELDKIFAFAENSENGLLIFIDEAEAFLADRDAATTREQSRELTQAFLDKVKKPSNKDIVFVFATNRRNVLDPAVENRISEVIHMPRPAIPEKLKLFNLYFDKEIIAPGVPCQDGLREKGKELVTIMDKNLVGRDIEEMIQKFRREARFSEDGILTFDMARGVIAEMNVKLATQRQHQSSLRDDVQQQGYRLGNAPKLVKSR